MFDFSTTSPSSPITSHDVWAPNRSVNKFTTKSKNAAVGDMDVDGLLDGIGDIDGTSDTEGIFDVLGYVLGENVIMDGKDDTEGNAEMVDGTREADGTNEAEGFLDVLGCKLGEND
mmetsp:Transcript_21421/g.24628  ORF Transcript_21421/g.24628 Transcript_21421/m.24628 type:complete len:116 (-) Transcript_21421:757-1104(-)